MHFFTKASKQWVEMHPRSMGCMEKIKLVSLGAEHWRLNSLLKEKDLQEKAGISNLILLVGPD